MLVANTGGSIRKGNVYPPSKAAERKPWPPGRSMERAPSVSKFNSLKKKRFCHRADVGSMRKKIFTGRDLFVYNIA